MRFSKDKTPYKTHFGLTWHRTKPQLRGGYYLHLSPKEVFLACGFWDPQPADLQRIRQELAVDGDEYRDIINAPDFKSVWGDLEGDAVKTAPKGYRKDHPNDSLHFKLVHLFSVHIPKPKPPPPTFWTA